MFIALVWLVNQVIRSGRKDDCAAFPQLNHQLRGNRNSTYKLCIPKVSFVMVVRGC
jgi:hypothetical protein